jgi:hypothetical protein
METYILSGYEVGYRSPEEMKNERWHNVHHFILRSFEEEERKKIMDKYKMSYPLNDVEFHHFGERLFIWMRKKPEQTPV